MGRGRFTLLTGIGGAPWREAVRVVGEELGLQIAVHGIGAGQDLADPTAELRAALHSILGTRYLVSTPDSRGVWSLGRV